MKRDSTRYEVPTRREYLKYGGVVIGGGLLAGCTSSGAGDGVNNSGGKTNDSDGSSGDGNATSGGGANSYSVSMEPVGTVEFEKVPKTWFPYTADYADMGVALGQGDGLSAIGVRARYGTYLYEELSGVSVDKSDLTELWQDGTGKEIFYELDADVHVIDPNYMIHALQWDQTDVGEISNNIAPFFGNTIFTRVYGWHDYRYYSMYEAFGKLADVFQEKARYKAFKRYHDKRLAAIHSRLPKETPDVALLYPAGVPPEAFYPYLIGNGTASKHWNDLRVGDALAQHGITDTQAGGGTIDYETLLEIDPDVIAIRLQGEITQTYFEQKILSPMRNHPVASELQAVKNGRVIYGGLTFQGPIIHLFQLERAAKQLYPDKFGDWPGYGDDTYPELKPDGQLFDRKRVGDIITGDF